MSVPESWHAEERARLAMNPRPLERPDGRSGGRLRPRAGWRRSSDACGRPGQSQSPERPAPCSEAGYGRTPRRPELASWGKYKTPPGAGRSRIRHRTGPGKTGRAIPDDFIKFANQNGSKVLPEAIEKGLFDDVRLWDTNINGTPRLILEHKNNVTKIHDQKLYERFLAKRDPNTDFSKFKELDD